MNERDMTLYFHSILENKYKRVRDLVNAKSDFLFIAKDSENEIIIKLIHSYPSFIFHISNPVEKGNNLVFNITRAPKNARSNETENLKSDHLNLERTLNSWIELAMKHLNKKPIHPNQDDANEQYSRDFYDWFEIVDEDADSTPYDIKRQILIEHSLDAGIKALIESGLKEDDPIILEARSLKEKIGIFTKKQVLKAGRSIYVMIRKHGGVFTKRVYDVWSEEMLKMGYHELLKFLGQEALRLLQ